MERMHRVFAQIFSVVSTLVLALVVIVSPVLAQSSSLTLQSIGSSMVNGQTITSWTYMGTNPAFVGTATPDETVTVDINGVSGTATADSTGSWTFTPTNITDPGSYTVSITAGTSSLDFTLLVSTAGATATPSAEEAGKGGVVATNSALPVTGGLEDTLLLSAFGLGLVGIAFLFIANLRRQPLEVEVE